ncbi:MAG: hypothetical protein AAF465_04815 [Pseudomonadota bacterium]
MTQSTAVRVTLVSMLLFASTAFAGVFVEFVFGNVRTVKQLERFSTIDDTTQIERLARVTYFGQSDGLVFPDGHPIGSRWGEIQYNRGLPLYYTTFAGWRSSLYRWRNNRSNFYDTQDAWWGYWQPPLWQANVFGYDAPTCVGIRGNGPRLWAHFSSLARVTEEFGLIGGAAGGSSGSISVFVTESIHANPLLTRCGGGKRCSKDEATARMALLFKSVEGLSDAGLIDDIAAVGELVALIQAGDIAGLLAGDQPQEGVDALIAILQDEDLQQILNPEILTLLLTSPDPVFHANDIVQGTLAALSFQVNDPTPLVRPGPVNFDSFANIVGRLGNFYAGYGPFDRPNMRRFMEHCAAPGTGLDWPAVSALPAPGGTCGTLFTSLFENFKAQYDPDTGRNRLDDPIGRYLRAYVTTSVLEGAAVDEFGQARQAYLAAQPVSLNVDFDDVKFGYWGRADDLVRAEHAISEFADAKSARFSSLGETAWRDILAVSPAEPGLSRAVELPDGRVSAGGWSDPVPTQVLVAGGCERVVLINRQDGIGGFTTGVATQLGATQSDLDDLYDLSDPQSGFTTALSEANGVWCTNWDAPDSFDIAALAAEGWDAPLETDDPALLDYLNAGTGLGIPGCTPGVAASRAPYGR